MKQDNRITDITRKKIASELSTNKLEYYGGLTEADFLNKLFNLKSLPSEDRRYNNAYDDIYQHTVNNMDWESEWVYNDSRINLLYCDDKTYMRFLELTLDPSIRVNEDEVNKLKTIYNDYLNIDGFEVIETDEISGIPIHSCREKTLGQAGAYANEAAVKELLDTKYVRSKISLMNKSINENPDLAIGTAKELLETVCKSILKQKSVEIEKEWILARLLKETINTLDFTPKKTANPESASISIKKILGGISTIVQGVTELRNNYGTGHGKDADFIPLEPKYADLLVGAVTLIAKLFLETNGETTELVEE